MRKFLNRYLLLVVIVLLACFVLQFIFSGAYHILSFNDIILYFLYGVFVALSSIVIYRDIKYYRSGRGRFTSFLPSLIIVVTIFSFIYTARYVRRLDAAPVVFTAYGMQDFNGVYIQFREDSTYRITEYVLFAADYYRGTYSLHDSIIELYEKDQFRKDGSVVSNRFKIILQIDTATDVAYKKLIQIDDTKNKIENSEVFSIKLSRVK